MSVAKVKRSAAVATEAPPINVDPTTTAKPKTPWSTLRVKSMTAATGDDVGSVAAALSFDLGENNAVVVNNSSSNSNDAADNDDAFVVAATPKRVTTRAEQENSSKNSSKRNTKTKGNAH